MPGIRRTATTPKPLMPQLKGIRSTAYENPDAFVQTQLKVVNHKGDTVPFKYTWSQLQVARKIKEIEAQKLPIRLYILKSRQVGMSTMIAARIFSKVWAKDNTEALIMAHQEIRAKELIGRCKFFYTSLKDSLKLKLAQDSKAALQFADTRGLLNIISAKNWEAAVGGTKQLLQLSEFSRYSKAMTILQGMEHPVIYSPGTEVYLETTGHGHGTEAHQFWDACKAGYENYVPLFLAWQNDPACTWKFESERDRDYKLGEAYEYEPRLEERMRHFKLSAGNVYYCYQYLKNKSHGDYEDFLENYPCDDEEAWRASGQSYFGAENINALKTADFPFTYKVWNTFSLDREFTTFDDLQTVEMLDENGNKPFLKIWKGPNAMASYVVSGDSAEGLEDGNFSSTFVIDMDTLEMMAEFHGKVRPDEHARIISSVCNIYNGAIAAPEYNTPGNVTLSELKRVYFGNIYRWRWVDDHKFKLSNKLGWQTNSTSRPLMLQLGKRIVADVAKDRIMTKGIIKSRMLVDEMKTFVVNELDGSPEATAGSQDDRVMAWCIALIVAYQEGFGMGRDIFTLYKGYEGNELPIPENNNQGYDMQMRLDPSDVISRLIGENEYGAQRIR